MEKTPHNDFFTDNQTAVALGLTLRSLQNKIHREKVAKISTLPAHHMASARGRLWEKKALETFLHTVYNDTAFVAERMDKGKKAPPLGSMGANEDHLKIPVSAPRREKKPPPPPKRKVGRPPKVKA